MRKLDNELEANSLSLTSKLNTNNPQNGILVLQYNFCIFWNPHIWSLSLLLAEKLRLQKDSELYLVLGECRITTHFLWLPVARSG